jgi:mannosylglycerate hydrolase
MTKIHLVSHTHWDREWYLTFQQFRLKLVHLIDHLLNLLDQDPDYRYFLLDGQTILLEDYLEIRPERQADLTRHIKNGRILIGPWYVSPDEFLVSPESHIRNLLEGEKISQAFGAKMLVGYLPDDFGHIGQMPQILRGFEIDSACLWRGLDEEPCELDWKAPDGSSVLLSYLRDSYSNAASLNSSIPEIFVDDINILSSSLSSHSAIDEILLMQGTDHMEPLDDLSHAIRFYQRQSKQNNLIHSNLSHYFDSLRTQLASKNEPLPVVYGELRSSKHSALLQNVLSTRIWLKQRNCTCETELIKWVEPLNVWNNILKIAHPSRVIDHKGISTTPDDDQKSVIHFAWKLLMQCHPHDSICGTSVDQVANEMRTRFDQVDQISHELINQSLENICNHIDTRLADDPAQSIAGQNILSAIVVFNPNDTSQSGLVNLSIKLTAHYSSYEILDSHSQLISCDFSGLGSRELISIVLDNKALKQAFGMIHEGHVAGMVLRDFEINRQEKHATVHATLSDHGNVNINRWRDGVAQLNAILADPTVTEFHIHAYSDPEIQLSFVASDVPPHGFACYWIKGRIELKQKVAKSIKLNPILQTFIPLMARAAQIQLFSKLFEGKNRRASRLTNRIENEYFVVEVHASTGTLTVTDKRTHQVFGGLNKLIDSGDRGDLYNYCPPENDLTISPQVIKVEYEKQNTYKKLILYYSLKIPAELSNDRTSRSHEWVTNSVISTVTLVSSVPRVDIHTEITNLSHDHRLRVHFPAPFSCVEAWNDGHFEIVQRPIGLPSYDKTWEEPPRPEVPQRRFTSITDNQTSLTIANLGLPEVEVFNNHAGNSEVAVTLMRCVGWLSRDDLTTRKSHAGPMEVPVPDAQMVGSYAFDYTVIPGNAHWRDSLPQAESFSAPLKSIISPLHAGSLPSVFSLIKNSNPDFILTSIKTAEDGAGFIIRGYNILASPLDTTLTLFNPIKHAQLVSLNEKLIEPIPISPEGSIDLQVSGHKIVTLRLEY